MKTRSLSRKYSRWGWIFVFPAVALICILSFFPMIQAFILSLQTGTGNNLRYAGLRNYIRLFRDKMFITSVANVFVYLVIQVPIMLFMALVLASVLNSDKLKFRGFFRTLVFLPSATALVSSALIFKSFFAPDGFVNIGLMQLNLISQPVGWLTNPVLAKAIIILVITWRWTGYDTIFYLAGLQNINTEIYEAALIDGASPAQRFFKITLPLLRPVILLTTVMSTNGTLQLFDEVYNMTAGGPGIATMTISQHIFNLSFRYNPQFGYAAAVSYMILIMVALLSFIQIKAGDQK
jgi:lactose/L-arabinose transport system permease protein